MSKHTKGPWRWVETPSTHTLDHRREAADVVWDGQGEFTEGQSFDELRGADGVVLYGVWCNDDTAMVGPASAADARLIAAAPELLAALKTMAKQWDMCILRGDINGGTGNSEIAWAARDAIAKAEGR